MVYAIDALGDVTQKDYDALGQVARTTRYARAIPASTLATLAGISAALALNATRVDNRALNLPGTSGSYASTPDSPAVSVTGDLDLRVRVSMNDWTPDSSQTLIAKQTLLVPNTGAQASYAWVMGLDVSGLTGKPRLFVSLDGQNYLTASGSVASLNVSVAAGICL